MCTQLCAYTYMLGRIFLRRPRRILLGVLVTLVLCVLVLERWPERGLVNGGVLVQERDAFLRSWADDSVAGALLDLLPEQNSYATRVPIPLVGREHLEKLYMLGTEETTTFEDFNEDQAGVLDQADDRYSLRENRSGYWPPIVTALPEARSSSSASRLQVNNITPIASTENAIDAQFCASTPCRLLVLLTIAEREPRMQEQLLQVLALAQALNRTVVLPNVGKGRIGTCQRWDFDTYFDIASAVRAGGGRAMLMDNFRTWVDVRPRSPTMHSVVVDEGPMPEAGSTVEHSLGMQERARKNTRCFASRFRSLNLDEAEASTIYLLPSMEQGQNQSDQAMLVNALYGNVSDDDTSTYGGQPLELNNDSAIEAQGLPHAQHLTCTSFSDANILLLHWDVHRQIFPTLPDAPIDYSPRLWALADQVTREIHPYLAVHWHVDKVPAAVLPACADALVDTLDILLHDHSVAQDIQTVYFSSDYPLLELDAEASPKVDKRMTYLHRQAGRILKAAFEAGGELEHWRLEAKEDILASLSNNSLNGLDEDRLSLDDVGIRDMLAKAMSMKAALFVSNTKGCGRMRCILI